MGVAGVLGVYGGGLVLASVLQLDAGVPTPEPSQPVAAFLGAVALVNAAIATHSGTVAPKKGETGFVRYMAAVHLGLLVPLGCAAFFATRAYATRAFHDRAHSLLALTLGSVVTFGWLVALKPQKASKTD